VAVKIKQGALIACLSLFLFVVIGGGLHLNPGGALLAAATGTPLVIHLFERKFLPREFDGDSSAAARGARFARNTAEASPCSASEAETALRK